MRYLRVPGIVIMLLAVASAPTFAIPSLQVYIEGATYSAATETWIATGTSFQLWVIGNVGGKGSMSGVKLAAAVASDETGTIDLNPTQATNTALPMSPFNRTSPDPSKPDPPNVIMKAGSEFSADGAIPQMGSGRSLPSHGVYGPGTRFKEWMLGEFTLMDSSVGDFIDAMPTSFSQMGQLNAYTVTVTGFASGVHFDAYNGTTFAPFSHDSESNIPEPSSLLLLGVGLVGATVAKRRRQRTQSSRAR